ncbi:serum amyloid P-component-like [Hyla sarda]|uniref:serum amyloid P-component-like n=1 Tax=Hyla sarda TaxID=327740 RepID=UPI0024C29B1A|nr:serum amyloid P-component-like [Hyla sarda]XP_056408527.1 serum amyloid P-component-like [Hyla sarda]
MDIEKMLVWMLLCISRVLGWTDMKEKLFSFPKQSSTSYVELFPELSGPFEEATVCMRFHSDLTRGYSLFSLSTRSKSNDFLLYYFPGSNKFSLSVSDIHRYNILQGNNFTEWTSICVTWNSSVGSVWIDGKKYNIDRTANVTIGADPIIIIGQEQDSYGGGFETSQSFVGEITNVHMWDKALTDNNIIDYCADNEISGNVINWNALRYNLTGNVNTLLYVDPYPCEPVYSL